MGQTLPVSVSTFSAVEASQQFVHPRVVVASAHAPRVQPEPDVGCTAVVGPEMFSEVFH